MISVITAASPRDAVYVKGLAHSIISQVDSSWEWLVQEDGPTSEWRVVEELTDQVRYANSPTVNGPAVARNLAVALARGEIVRNVDADDELTPGVLAYTADVFSRHPEVDYLVGPVVDVLEDGTEREFDEILAPGPIAPGTLFQLWIERNHFGAVHPTCLAIRRSVFLRNGGYTALPVSEDTALLLATSQNSLGWFADRPLAKHRKRSASITSQGWASEPVAASTRYEFIRRRCELLVES